MWKSAWKSICRSWTHHTAVQTATFLVLVGVFCVISTAFGIQKNMERILSHWGESVRITAYLSSKSESKEIDKAREKIMALKHVERVEFIGKEQAAEKFLLQLGEDARGLFDDPAIGNPLPETFEIALSDSVANKNSFRTLKRVAGQIIEIPEVEEVSYGQDWVKNYASLTGAFSQSSWILILILLAGALFIVSNSIRVAVSQRRDELEIMELVGATPAEIRFPFIVEGAVTGGLAGLVSSIFTFALFEWQTGLVNQQVSFLGLAGTFRNIGGFDIISIIILGAGVGAVGSYLCVKKVATGWSASKARESWARR